MFDVLLTGFRDNLKRRSRGTSNRRRRRVLTAMERLESRRLLAADLLAETPYGPVPASPIPMGFDSALDFTQLSVTSHGRDQDSTGNAEILDGGATLHLSGNTWKKVDLDYDVTSNTVIEFDFRSPVQGEIHSIGFDNDSTLSRDLTFKVYGTQSGWGIPDYNSYASSAPQTKRFQIPIGQHYTGSFDRLVFGNDHDRGAKNGEGYFSNVKIFEQGLVNELPNAVNDSYQVSQNSDITPFSVLDNDNTEAGESLTIVAIGATSAGGNVSISNGVSINYQPAPGFSGTETFSYTINDGTPGNDATATVTVDVTPATNPLAIDFGNYSIDSHGGGQDVRGEVQRLDDGSTLHLMGNLWKKIDFDYVVTPNTMLEFDFRSSSQGEVHTIGFDNDTTASANRAFSLYGTQSWGNRDFFDYSETAPQERHYTIPVGQYYTGTFDRLFFGNDHDVSGANAESYFSNVVVYEAGDPINHPPIAQNDSYSVDQGSGVINLSVLDNDTTEPGETLTIVDVGSASDGGSISVSGGTSINYQPAADFAGTETFTYTINDGTPGNNATATVTVEVARQMDPSIIDFTNFSIDSQGGGQDAGGSAERLDGGATLRLSGNTWKHIDFDYQVTPNTILEFDFRSSAQGDVHTIGFDTDATLDENRGFALYGRQHWGIRDHFTYGASAPNTEHYVIPVGQHYTGQFDRIFFGNDHDTANANAESVFSNVRVYEAVVTNDPPVANNDAFSVEENSSPTTLDVLSNDTTETGETLSITSIGVTSAGGSASVVNGNAILYQPATGFAGTETFTYTINDGTPGNNSVATVTVTVTEQPTESGLLGEYFDNIDLSALADTKIDSTIAFYQDWGDAPSGTAVNPDDTYSVRWTGSVYIAQSGNWEFSTTSNDGVRLWVGQQQLIDNWNKHTVVEDDGTVSLTQGWHPIRLEYFQDGGTAEITLSFQGPGQSKAIIPASHLSTTNPDGDLPVVDAGPDRSIRLPENEVTLVGQASDDGAIVSYNWSQESGPSTATLVGATTDSVTVGNLVLGDYTFVFSATDDDGHTAHDSVIVNVLEPIPVNPPPTANDDTFSTSENGGTVSLNVLANDTTDAGETLTITAVGSTSAGGSATVINGNSIRYQPATGFVGAESFTYTINDGTPGNDSVATVTVIVSANPGNDDFHLSEEQRTGDWVWRPVRLGAGGYVTGIDIAPDGTKVVRTDTAGPFKWNESTGRWYPMFTTFSLPDHLSSQEMANSGTFALAIAPSNSDIMYAVWGGRVFKTTDGGESWQHQTSFPTLGTSASANKSPEERSLAANGVGDRILNPKMAVDDQNPDHVYLGTRAHGLFRTIDGGTTWENVSSVPVGSEPGSLGTVFDTTSPIVNGRRSVFYTGTGGSGVYRTTDGGETFQPIGGPATVTGATMDQSTYYVITDSRQAWRYDGSWTQIYFGSNARSIAADPNRPGRIALVERSGDLMLSDDGGDTFTNSGKNRGTVDIPWHIDADTGYMSAAQIEFDPADPNVLYFSQGIGVWKATLPSGPVDASWKVTWNGVSRGIEELVSNFTVSPPGGTQSIYSVWDRGTMIMDNDDLDAYADRRYPTADIADFSHGWWAGYAATDPEFILLRAEKDGDKSGYSPDGGTTWFDLPNLPENKPGGAGAASTSQNFILINGNNGPGYYTLNGGTTWNPLALPGTSGPLGNSNYISAFYLRRQPVAADHVTPGKFYFYHSSKEIADSQRGLYQSTDGGASWELVYNGYIGQQQTDNWNAVLQSVPGHEDHLFFTPGYSKDGGASSGWYFKRSTDGGESWSEVHPDITEVASFTFGPPAQGSDYPRIYIAGYLDSGNGYEPGIYYSDDEGVNWTMMTDYPLGRFDIVKSLAATWDGTNKLIVSYGDQGSIYATFDPVGPSSSDSVNPMNATDASLGALFDIEPKESRMATESEILLANILVESQATADAFTVETDRCLQVDKVFSLGEQPSAIESGDPSRLELLGSEPDGFDQSFQSDMTS